MIDISDIGTMFLGGGGLVTGCLSLYSIRTNLKKIDSEADVNQATRQKIEAEAVALNDATEQRREEFWNKKLEDAKSEFNRQIHNLNEEIGWMRLLIENHVPWDWEVQRLLIKAGIEHRKPPTLQYIKSKTQIKDDEE